LIEQYGWVRLFDWVKAPRAVRGANRFGRARQLRRARANRAKRLMENGLAHLPAGPGARSDTGLAETRRPAPIAESAAKTRSKTPVARPQHVHKKDTASCREPRIRPDRGPGATAVRNSPAACP